MPRRRGIQNVEVDHPSYSNSVCCSSFWMWGPRTTSRWACEYYRLSASGHLDGAGTERAIAHPKLSCPVSLFMLRI